MPRPLFVLSVQKLPVSQLDLFIDSFDFLLHFCRNAGCLRNELHQVTCLSQQVLDLGNVGKSLRPRPPCGTGKSRACWINLRARATRSVAGIIFAIVSPGKVEIGLRDIVTVLPICIHRIPYIFNGIFLRSPQIPTKIVQYNPPQL